MNQNEKNRTPILLWIEKTDQAWLKKEANKRKISIVALIRSWIAHFKNEKKDD